MNGFDSNRDEYLDYVARCQQAFTPFAPIELPDFFAGRKEIIDDIGRELRAPGRQVAIYGERGVGKTSLALLLYFFAGYNDDEVQIFRCDRSTTFDDICRSLLADAGHVFGVNGAQAESARTGEGRIGPVGVGASQRTTVSYRAVRDAQTVTLGRMLEAFQKMRQLLIIDEFDRVRDPQTKTRMAELIKHFSDARSQTKIVIVGVAETLSELIGEHESLGRSLAQVGLKRMHERELGDIIEHGSKRTGVKVDSGVAHRIVCLADGFPHFVHLVCLYASLAAGECLKADDGGRPRVGEREYRLALKTAIGKSEHSLQEAYEVATVTTRRKSDIYELTLRAMALTETRDVQVRELACLASQLSGTDIRPEKFSNALGQLVKEERARILTKVRDGYYKYTNPLMRPYIRLLLEFDNVTEHDGQLQFPFMRSR